MIVLVDTPLSLDQLASPRVIYSLLRPLQAAYVAIENPAIIYALMAVRMHFLEARLSAAALQSVAATRARVCAIVATNVLRALFDRQLSDETKTYSDALLPMARLLIGSFNPFQGAPLAVIDKVRSWKGDDWEGPDEVLDDTHGKSCALELAILSESKLFIKSPTVQLVIDAIWRGRLVYAPSSWIADQYKRTQISIYNVRAAPLLDHSRLTVPYVRARLEFIHFCCLMALWLWTLQTQKMRSHTHAVEIVFMVYGAGFSLDKFASGLEHGWRVFSSNLWHGLDAALCVIHTCYLVARLCGSGPLAIQIAALGPILLFPRLAFVSLAGDLLVLSLRAMISKFIWLTALAVFCFAGFLSWLMTWIWFGLDGTGIDIAPQFHSALGPIVVVLYSCLANTLVVSVVVAILSHTFSELSDDATGESLYRRAVTTFEGRKSDAIFNYMNIAALLILTPIRLLASPRQFHTVNIFAARVCNFPILLIISAFERSPLSFRAKRTQPGDSLPSRLGLSFEASAHADIDAVFQIVPESLPDTALGDDDDHMTIRGQSHDSNAHVGPQGAERASRMHPDVQRPPHASSRHNSSRLLSAGKPAPPSSTDEDEPRGRGRERPRGRPTSPRGRKEGLARIVTPMRRTEDEHLLRRMDNLEATLARIEETLRASLGGVDDDD